MRKISKGLLHHLLVVSLCLSCAVALAVPKAAENEDEAVTFGEAGSRPKPSAKHATPPLAKDAGGTQQAAGKPAKHAGSKGSRQAAGKAGGVSKGSKPAAATKPQRPAKPKGASSAKTPKTTPPVKKAPEKTRSSGTARKK